MVVNAGERLTGSPVLAPGCLKIIFTGKHKQIRSKRGRLEDFYNVVFTFPLVGIMFYIPPDQLRFWRGNCIARRFQQSKHHITLEESSKSTILLFILFAGEKPSQFSTPNCPLKVFIFLKTFSCFQGVQSLSRRGFFTRTYGPFHCFPTGVSQLGVVLPSRAGVF